MLIWAKSKYNELSKRTRIPQRRHRVIVHETKDLLHAREKKEEERELQEVGSFSGCTETSVST